jgi:hypothetical protein
MFATVSSSLTWGFSRKREPRPSPPQLPLPHPSTHPRARKRRHNQHQRIPMRPKRRALVPRHNRPRNTHDKTDKAGNHGMPHWPIRSKSRRDIAAHNTKDNPIRRRQHQRPIAHRLPPRRKHAYRMQHHIGDSCQNNTHHNPGNHSPNASANASGRAHSPPRSQIPSSLRQLTTIHPLFCRSLSAPGAKAQQPRKT